MNPPKVNIDVSVVIISWNMKPMLRDLLFSIYERSEGVRYEVIVVDNASADGTAEMVTAEFPNVRLVRNTENRGVAPARNQAYKLATARYIMSIDADMLLTENSLKKLTEFMDAHPEVGLCGAKLVSPTGELQPSCRRFPTPFTQLLRRLPQIRPIRSIPALRYHEMRDWDRREIREVDYVIGACQFIRRRAMEKVGMLDEAIFYGPEDVDYCLRMKRAGWKVYYFPHTSIIHYEQRATKRNLFSILSLRHLIGVIYLYRKYGWRLG